MTNFDDRIRAGLNNTPASPPRPIGDLQTRAWAIHNRRRAAATGVVLVAAGAVAFPFAMTGTHSSVADDAAPPEATASTNTGPGSDAEETVPCESWEGEHVGIRHLAIDEVPDDIRLLWDDDLAPPPTRASANDQRNSEHRVTDRSPKGCTIRDPEPDSVVLVETDGDVVTRRITVFSPAEVEDGMPEDDSFRTISAAGTEISVREDDGRLSLMWPESDGQYWVVGVVGGMTDSEIAEFTGAVRMTDGEIDASSWPGYEDIYAELHSDNPTPLERDVVMRVEGPVKATISQDRDGFDLWWNASVGDRVVDIKGRAGLLNEASGHVYFLTRDDILVEIRTHDLTTDELLAIARSIEQVPADDPRLASVWQTEFDEPTD